MLRLRSGAAGEPSGAMGTFSVGALNAVPRVASLIAELTRTRGVDDLISRAAMPARS
jgi:hypothetical protein